MSQGSSFAGENPVKTSIVVLTYRRVNALLAVLRALAPQCGEDTEVLIADDGSPSEDLQALRRQLPAFRCTVRHVWHPDVGFTAARARNMAAALAQGDRVIFLDGDCVPNSQFVVMHAKLARGNEFVNGSRVLLSPRLSAAVESDRVNLNDVSSLQWVQWWLRGDANKLIHRVHWIDAPRRRHAQFYWKGIRSCNLAVWRSDFERVNGFDESFAGWGHEDADFVLRLHHAGLHRCNGFLATEVFHLWHPENDRAQAAKNFQKVLDRSKDATVRAELGLYESQDSAGRVVTSLFP